VMYYFTFPISRVVSMGRRNTQLEPTHLALKTKAKIDR